MNSIYVFRQIPAPLKRLILYFIGQGTSCSHIIKEEYHKLNQINRHLIINKSIGFIGYKCMIQKFFVRTFLNEFYKRYKNDTNVEWLLPQHMYEIDDAKAYYYDNYGHEYNNHNARNKFCLGLTINSDNHSLYKLFKYRILKLMCEEE